MMGAQSFMVRQSGSTLSEAFQSAVNQAQWDYGHGGYTGSIAEKDDVREVRTPKILMTDDDKIGWASSLLHEEIADSQWEWINDKWGPAAALRLSSGEWLLFGWASS
jgi:hypothetical protein